MPDQEISFAQLVALMAVGEGRDRSMRGVVRHREAEPAHDDEPANLEIPGDVRYRHQEEHIRVLMRGELARREQLDGRLLAIQGPETLWVWEDGQDEPTAFPRRTTAWGWPDSVLTQRREMDGWRGDDFTRPAAAPVSTTFLGRSAWQVELLPPPHKLFPLVLTVDAETGLVLSDPTRGSTLSPSGSSSSSMSTCPTSCSSGTVPPTHPAITARNTTWRWLDARAGWPIRASVRSS
ncbi:MAG: hypothetical protein QOE64_1781 [Frankiales bacterium]|jgi:hypothetical protein|nr:hypothetical protein [Frankiales bacterium]